MASVSKGTKFNAGLSIALFGVAAIGGYAPTVVRPEIQISVRVVLAGIAFWTSYLALKSWAAEGVEPEPSRGPRNGQIEDLLDTQRSLAEQSEWTYETAVRLAGRLANPGSDRTRVREWVTFTESSLRREVCVEHELGSVSDRSESFALLTLLRVRRGELVDDFRAWQPSGETVRTLTHAEVGQLLTRLARTLIVGVLSADSAGSEGTEALDRLVRAAQRLMAGIDGGDSLEELHSRIGDAVAGGPGTPRDSAVLLSSLLETLADTHPIVAVVPLPGGGTGNADQSHMPVSVFYAHGLPRHLEYGADMATTATARARAWIRRHIWARPTTFPIPAAKALSTDSYHLEVQAPEGCLIGRRWLEDHPEDSGGLSEAARTMGRVILPERGAPSVWYADIDGPDFYPKVHLYTRNYAARNSTSPHLVVQVVEELPGALGRAFTAALATALVLWVVGTWGLDEASSTVDLLAFLVAFPGVLAAWTAFGRARPNPFVSLVTRLSIACSALLAVLGVGLFLGQTNDGIASYSLPWGLNFLLVSDVFWVALFGLALTNLGWTGGTLFVRSIRHLGKAVSA